VAEDPVLAGEDGAFGFRGFSFQALRPLEKQRIFFFAWDHLPGSK
jgi:hypothetical protein